MVRGSLPNGLKQYETTVAVTADEVYFFKKEITPQTVTIVFTRVLTPPDTN